MDIRKLTVSLFTACTLVASLIAPLGSGLNNFKSDHALTVEAADVNNSLSGTPVLCTLVANSSNGGVVLQPNKKYYSPNADYYAKFQSDGLCAGLYLRSLSINACLALLSVCVSDAN